MWQAHACECFWHRWKYIEVVIIFQLSEEQEEVEEEKEEGSACIEEKECQEEVCGEDTPVPIVEIDPPAADDNDVLLPVMPEPDWITWEVWTDCSRSCGDSGMRNRIRSCQRNANCPIDGKVCICAL